MINEFTFLGRIYKEPEAFSKGAYENITLSIAVQRKPDEQECDFFKVTCDYDNTKRVAENLQKGDFVYVKGSIRTGHYEKNGERVYYTKYAASQIKPGNPSKWAQSAYEKYKAGRDGSASSSDYATESVPDDDVPF